jgi:hypothetical protein
MLSPRWEGKTCSLEEVFAIPRQRKVDPAPPNAKGGRNLSKRNSSGNWMEDRLTWKEEMKYKMGMGYI